MSRRLNIASLLNCDDPVDDHVPLAPHLRSNQPSTSSLSSSSQPASRSRATTYDDNQPSRPSSSHQQPQPFGLDALAHAATQERRRLSGSELVQPQPQGPPQPPIQQEHQPQPPKQQQFSPHQHHQQLQRQSPQFHRSPWQEEASYRQPHSPLHPRSIDDLSVHSPREAYKHPASPYAQPRQHSYEDEQRLHQIRQLQVERERDRERHLRAQERQQQQQRIQLHMQQEDRMRAQELATREHKALLERERQRMEEERLKLEAERKRLMEIERRIQERKEEQRREAQRARIEEDRREREVAAIREAERREQQRRDRELDQLRRQEEQRYYSATADMQRQEDAQRRLQHIHQQQQRQQYIPLQHPQAVQQHPPINHLTQRVYDHPPRIEIPSGPQIMSTRKSDPISIIATSQSQSAVMTSAQHMSDQRSSKKRRYSESPGLPPMPSDDNVDRIQREREKMTVGEIGYGRFDSPNAAYSASSYTSPSSLPIQPPLSISHRPGSGHGTRKPVSVSDLLTPDHEGHASGMSSPSLPIHSPKILVIPSRDPNSPSHLSDMPSSFPPHHTSVHHRIVSPLGRRSPPGSQTGRAKASRKAEDHVQPTAPSSSSSTPPIVAPTIPHPVIAASDANQASSSASAAYASLSMTSPVGSRDEVLHRQPPAMKRSKIEKDERVPSPMSQDPQLPMPRKVSAGYMKMKEKESKEHIPHQTRKSVPLAEKVERSPVPPSQKEEGDAHDWLLEHYAQTSPPSRVEREPPSQAQSALFPARAHQHRTNSPSFVPPAPSQTKSPSLPISSKKQSPIKSPVAQDEDEDDGGLDEELEQLLAEVKATTPKDEPDDMDVDVDTAVAELVAETLEDLELPKERHSDGRRRQRREEEHDGDAKMHPVDDVADDVEDELLSLVEDKAPVPPASKEKTAAAKPSKPTATARKPKSTKAMPPPLRTSGMPSGSTLSPPLATATSTYPASAPVSKTAPIRPSTGEAADRDSMPPPTTTAKDTATKKSKGKPAEKEKDNDKDVDGDHAASDTAAPPVKKKATKKVKANPDPVATPPAEGIAPSAPSTSIAPKHKAKPKAKKVTQEAEVDAPSADATDKPTLPPTKSAVAVFQKGSSASRSRSTSVMPTAADESASPGESKESNEDDVAEAPAEDDKLYCVCKTKYDQERFMIACDRCDEWYHMQCVDMPDLVADLVDQFFCPPCIEKNPELHLTTTYKQRCLWGLKHPDPGSPAACHKPARGAFSKYCSEECGVKYMQSRIDSWAKKGGKKEKLWESVKHVEKREGVVVRVEPSLDCPIKPKAEPTDEDIKPLKYSNYSHLKPSNPTKGKSERDKERLLELLDKLAKMQTEIRKAIEIITWRERLLSLAADRAESTSQCGWDQRLCFGDEDWEEELGKTIMSSYEAGDDTDRMEVDNAEWWCSGESVCSRHVGWQSTRYKDVAKEREKREEALAKLEAREQQLRQRLEELANPSRLDQPHRRPSNAKANNSTGPGSKAALKTLQSTHTKLSNGHSKAKANAADAPKKGKKRKAP